MLITDNQIREAIKNGEIKISDYKEDLIQPATYDMRVGNEGFLSSLKQKIHISKRGLFILEPGDYGIVLTLESIELSPNYAGRFGIRSSFLRKGLMAAVGPQIDPGFKGRLKIGLFNLSPKPIVLGYKDPFLSVEFHKLSEPVKEPYIGPYQNQYSLSASDYEDLIFEQGMTFTEIIKAISSLSVNVEGMRKSINNLSWIIGIGFSFVAILISVIAILK